MSDYPRTPGSDIRVEKKNWNQNAPFGHCPACGSLAMEDIPIPGDLYINFYCSDITCRNFRGRRTMWGLEKTSELLELEESGGSWNEKNFPGQNLPSCCPD